MRCWLVFRRGLLGQPLAERLECGSVGREPTWRRMLSLPLGQLQVDKEHLRSPARCISRRLLLITGGDAEVVRSRGRRHHELFEPLAEQRDTLFDQRCLMVLMVHLLLEVLRGGERAKGALPGGFGGARGLVLQVLAASQEDVI